MEEKYLFKVGCDCGYEMNIPNPEGVRINLIGLIQFICPECDAITNLSHNPLIQQVNKKINMVDNKQLSAIDEECDSIKISESETGK